MSNSITCPQCGITSWHPIDVQQRYCGNCHQYHDDDELLTITQMVEMTMLVLQCSVNEAHALICQAIESGRLPSVVVH